MNWINIKYVSSIVLTFHGLVKVEGNDDVFRQISSWEHWFVADLFLADSL